MVARWNAPKRQYTVGRSRTLVALVAMAADRWPAPQRHLHQVMERPGHLSLDVRK